MAVRDDEPVLERTAGYAFSQVAVAVVGGIILCTLISAVLAVFFGIQMSVGAATFITLFCIPIAWAIRALIFRRGGR